MSEIQCVVVTPEKTALEATAEFVVVPLFDGELGVLPGHSPMIGRLGYGELRLRTGNTTTRYYLDGGFVQVLDNTVTLLTNRAIPVRELDAEAAHDQLRHALQRSIATPELEEIRNRLIAQARSQIHVASKGT